MFKRYPMVQHTYEMEGAKTGTRFRWSDVSNHEATSKAEAFEYFKEVFDRLGLEPTRMTVIDS